MLPQDGELSSYAQISGFSYPVKSPSPVDMLQDWELAGVYLNDPSEGLLVKVWRARLVVDIDTDIGSIILSAPGGVSPSESEKELFYGEAITEIALAFDQNMNPFVAYTQAGIGKFWWYDPLVAMMVHTSLPDGCKYLRCTMDERRSFNIANSDIILSYIRDGNLCVRYQRERFTVEHVLKSGVGSDAQLVSMAMNRGLRIQWRLRNYDLTSDPGALFSTSPFLAEIIENLSSRAGLPADKIDVSDQYDKTVLGFAITNAYPCSSALQSLSEIFHFGPSNSDGKVKFISRGGDYVSLVDELDLIDDDQDIESQSKRGDTLGVPRVLHLNYYDYSGGLNTDKQHSERPEGTRAEGEASTQTAVLLTADQAATVVAKNHAIMVEAQKGEINIALPDNWLGLTDTDPIIVSYGGKSVRGIIAESVIMDGEQRYKVIRDRQSVYTMSVQGIPAAPITRPPSSIVGPTILHVLDIPHPDPTDDRLGVYIAVSGVMPAWQGAFVEMSLDGGENYLEGETIRSEAIVGTLTSDLEAYPGGGIDEIGQFSVYIPTPDALLSNATEQQMLNGFNITVVGDEIISFGSVDESSEGNWDISYLLRGVSNTDPVSHPVGTRFVMLSGAVFVPATQDMIGREITIRATSIGRSPETGTIATFEFQGRSQDVEIIIDGGEVEP